MSILYNPFKLIPEDVDVKTFLSAKMFEELTEYEHDPNPEEFDDVLHTMSLFSLCTKKADLYLLTSTAPGVATGVKSIARYITYHSMGHLAHGGSPKTLSAIDSVRFAAEFPSIRRYVWSHCRATTIYKFVPEVVEFQFIRSVESWSK